VVVNKVKLSSHERAITSMGESYLQWCTSQNLLRAYPVTWRALAAFLVARCQRLRGSAKTLVKTISMIKCYSGRLQCPWLDLQELMQLGKIVKYLQFMDQRAVRRVTPITISILKPVIDSPLIHPQIKVMAAVGHDGLTRGAELCSGLDTSKFKWFKNKRKVTLVLDRTKAHRSGGS